MTKVRSKTASLSKNARAVLDAIIDMEREGSAPGMDAKEFRRAAYSLIDDGLLVIEMCDDSFRLIPTDLGQAVGDSLWKQVGHA